MPAAALCGLCLLLGQPGDALGAGRLGTGGGGAQQGAPSEAPPPASAAPAAAGDAPAVAGDLSFAELAELAGRHGWELDSSDAALGARRYSPPSAAREDPGHFERWLLGAFDNAVRSDLPSGRKELLLLPPGEALGFGEVSALAAKHGWTLRLAVKEELAQGVLGGAYDVPAAARGDQAAFGDWLLGAFNALPERGPSGGGTLHLLGGAMDSATAQALLDYSTWESPYPYGEPRLELEAGDIATLPEVLALGEMAALHMRHTLRVRQLYLSSMDRSDLSGVRADVFEVDCAGQRLAIRACGLPWFWRELQFLLANGGILWAERSGRRVQMGFRHEAWGGSGVIYLAGDAQYMEVYVSLNPISGTALEAVPSIRYRLHGNADKLRVRITWVPPKHITWVKQPAELPKEGYFGRAGPGLYPAHAMYLFEEVGLLGQPGDALWAGSPPGTGDSGTRQGATSEAPPPAASVAAASPPPASAAPAAPSYAAGELSFEELSELAKRHGWRLVNGVPALEGRSYSPPAAAREDAAQFGRWLLGAFDHAVRGPWPSGGKALLLLPPEGGGLDFDLLSALGRIHGWELRRAYWEDMPEAYQVPLAARADAARFGSWLPAALGNAIELPEKDGMRVQQQLPPGLDAAWVGEARERDAGLDGRLEVLEEAPQLAPMALEALFGQPEWQALRDIATRQRGQAFRIRVAQALGAELGAAVIAMAEVPVTESSYAEEVGSGLTADFDLYGQESEVSFVEMHDTLAEWLSEDGAEGGEEREAARKLSAARAGDVLHVRLEAGGGLVRFALSGGALDLELALASKRAPLYTPLQLSMRGGAGSQWALWRVARPGGGAAAAWVVEMEALAQ